MRLHFEIALSFIVALLSMGLAACGPTVTVGHECAAACEEQHSDGLDLYNNLKGSCACWGCSEACTQSVCRDKQTPSNACLPCVQESLRGDACNEHAGLFEAGCLGTKACADLVACIVECGQ
jgi:hypothetical protein